MKKRLFFTIISVLAFCNIANAQIDTTSRYMRLFTPLRHYNDVVKNRFSFYETGDSTVDNILLRAYLTKPGMVASSLNKKKTTTTEKQIVTSTQTRKSGTSAYIAPDVDLNMGSVSLVYTKPNFWTVSGDFYLQMMQNFYSENWYQGGESNYSGLARVTLNFNYNNKQKIKFENKLEMNVGLQTVSSDTVHKAKTTSDLLRLTNRLGIQATKHWYYTIQNVATTQFLKSFDSNSKVVKSDFMSPFTDNLSIGMDYAIKWCKGRLTGNAHFAPIAVNLTHVNRLELAVRNGLEEGKHNRWQFGPNLNIETTWKFSDSFEWKTRLYTFSDFQYLDLQWENTFNFKLNRYLTATIYVYPKYDSNNTKNAEWGYLQLKEFTSLGLTYSF